MRIVVSVLMSRKGDWSPPLWSPMVLRSVLLIDTWDGWMVVYKSLEH